VVDVDDTLVNTNLRMQAVWRLILGCEVPLEAVETLSLEQIFMKFASPEQKQRAIEFQRRFWDVTLCLDEVGLESIGLNEAIPFAADVVQKWSKHNKLVYLTGRTQNTRDITLSELRKFGFPIEGAELVMFSLGDFARARGLDPSGPTLIDARTRRLSEICQRHDIVRAVDDYPGYFPVYRQFNVPDRIGLLRSRRFTPQDYLDRGATRVVKNWKELENDLP
jgi:hypothetical protein